MLITNVRELRPRVVYGFYLDRWPVEHPPLVPKIILGMQRQFVFNPICRERLLAFGLVAGNMLTWLAHQVPPQASGFPSTAAGQVWDRKPKQTPGRLRRTLAKADLSKLAWNNPTISKKRSKTDHLQTGILGHKRATPSRGSGVTGERLYRLEFAHSF